ncbi:hypothetical protein M758_UG016000 [Ceratodon purpureus]|nr:hypothetical protein M758_UG016000 [Ceratodon purpureus]
MKHLHSSPAPLQLNSLGSSIRLPFSCLFNPRSPTPLFFPASHMNEQQENQQLYSLYVEIKSNYKGSTKKHYDSKIYRHQE